MAERDLVAHLFRRAAFGARPDELAYYESRPYEDAVDELLSGQPLMGQAPPLYEGVLEPTAVTPAYNLVERVAVIRPLDQIQTDWLRRMVVTATPFLERMSLMLHDHFATAYSPGDFVDAPELTAQIALFYRHALGNWKTLCHAILEDVAMGMWLDSDKNLVGYANENLARELMELFILGVDGGYDEHTVREAARALTGYYLDINLDPLGPRHKMTFDPARHDEEDKTLFGRVGNFMPHDVVDILLEQPAAPVHLARRLVNTFVSPTPSSTLVNQVAATLLSTNWELKPAIRQILTSSEFMASRSALVKSPAEFVAGAWRALGVTDYATGNYWMGVAGQRLFDPPNVGGWVPNEGWLSAGFLLARYNTSVQLSNLHLNQFRFPSQAAVRATTTQGWAEILGMTELSSATRTALDSYLAEATTRAYSDQQKDVGMITLVVSSPDFSLA